MSCPNDVQEPLLEGRACAPTELASRLGIHVTEAVEHLDRLLEAGEK
jgi:predicted ArsR family transcriptional regulator